ncbi:MAG: septum formation initiator family protein [Candidatus Syntrophosphaera sp.]
MKKQKPKYRKAMNLLVLLILLFLLSWILIWGDNSFYKVWKQKREISTIREENESLKAENDSIARQNTRLKSDPEVAEEVAREEHGLIKPDEVIYRFKPAQPETPEGGD